MNKYKNILTTVDGIVFRSKLEAKRYSELILLQRAKNISELELQPPFYLEVNGIRVCKYIADFRYRDRETGKYIIEDCKGQLTQVYKLKKKLMLAVLGLTIMEITK